ncbi:hypothetical protein ACWA1F_08490 [Flavobacterium sp. 3-218]
MKDNTSKIFMFKVKEDYIYYLSELIIDTTQKSKRLKKYENEIVFLLKNNPGKKFIEAEFYESFSDKTSRLFQYIFNLIGDETKQAFSYRKFRKILHKNKRLLNIDLDALTSEEEFIIDEFHKLRNWSLHIPDSIFNHKREFFRIDDKFINENKSTIAVDYYQYFEIEFLEKQKDEINQVLNGVEIVLKKMKDDYCKLVGGKVEYKEDLMQVKPYAIMEVAKKSLDTQRGR